MNEFQLARASERGAQMFCTVAFCLGVDKLFIYLARIPEFGARISYRTSLCLAGAFSLPINTSNVGKVLDTVICGTESVCRLPGMNRI